MSELKAYYVPTRSGNSCHCYIKSEADKVIALLKDKANYYEHAYKSKSEELADTCRFYEDELRHQKYKRCLAMADYSMYHHFRMLEIYGKRLDNDRAVFKINFGLKWHYRWLELADKLKDKETK